MVYMIGANSWDVAGRRKTGRGEQLDDGHAAQFFMAHLDFVEGPLGGQITDPANPATVLPDSLYLSQKPSFFGSFQWPWVNPEGATHAERVLTLPAKARFDAGVA